MPDFHPSHQIVCPMVIDEHGQSKPVDNESNFGAKTSRGPDRWLAHPMSRKLGWTTEIPSPVADEFPDIAEKIKAEGNRRNRKPREVGVEGGQHSPGDGGARQTSAPAATWLRPALSGALLAPASPWRAGDGHGRWLHQTRACPCWAAG